MMRRLLQLEENTMNTHEPPDDARIALVTGGSRGLGRNISLHLASDGYDIVLTYRSQKEEGEAVVAEIEKSGRRAAALQLDVAKFGEFRAFRDAFAQTLQSRWQRTTFNALINNAGIDRRAPFAETTEDAFDSLMNVHFKGVYFLTQTLLPLIAEGGRIVNTSSGLARFAIPGYSAYGAMKGAIEVLTRYLAKELGPRKIGVNVIAPGVIETDFTREALSHPGAPDFFAANIALGRVGVPDDIGGVVAFLCSDAGRWVNGQRIEASGGMLL
jgi:NAD(P)-dependent dehydrogenase (short-subunit alcohol dehydrogenase family)